MSWWQGRSVREKYLFAIAAILLVVFVGYSLLLGPIESKLSTAQQNYASAKSDYIWLQHAAAKIETAKARGIQFGAAASSQAPALVLVQQALSAAGVQAFITNSAQNGKQVTVQFKACPFDKLLGAIASLSPQGITVTSMTTSKNTKVGTASGSVVFTAAG